MENELTPNQKRALEGISLPARVALSVLYVPVSLTLLLCHYAVQPFIFTHDVWNRLFLYLDCWDEPFPVFAALITWVILLMGGLQMLVMSGITN